MSKGRISNDILYLVLQLSIQNHHKLGLELYGVGFTSSLTNIHFVRLRKTKNQNQILNPGILNIFVVK